MAQAFAYRFVVEVIPSNTRREMERKLNEYLSTGVRLIW
jgi:hypothetical protein